MLRDLREAFRSVIATPGPTIVIIVTLALAIGANTAIFSVLNAVLLRPLGYPEPDRLVMLWADNTQQGIERSEVSTADYLDWRERSESFGGMIAAYRHLGFTLTGIDQPERLDSVQASPVLFRLLGVDPELGRVFSEADETPGNEHLVILSHAAWTRRFGNDRSIIERTIELDAEPYTVVGVMPEGFEFPPGEPGVEIWSPLTLSRESLLTRPHRQYNTVGRLAEGVTLGSAGEEMDAIAAQIAQQYPDSNEGWGVEIVSAHEQLVGDIGATLWILFGAVALVLLIGCVNVANLLITRSTEAAKDFVIRAALGASRLALMRRSLAESLVLALAGGVAGTIVAYWGVALLRQVIPSTVPRLNQVGIDANVLLFTGALTVASALVFGLVPAVRVMSPNLAEVLKSGSLGASASKSRWLSDLMVVFEVALALVLLAGAGLMVRSYIRLSDVDPGFRKENVVSVAIALPPSRYSEPDLRRRFFADLVDRVRQIPGIEAASAVSALPMSDVGVSFEMPFTVEGLETRSPTERPRGDYRGVFPGYFKTLAIPLIQGRVFSDFDGRDGFPMAIVNQSLADRYFADVDPIGKMVSMPMAGSLQIVGVVGDIRHGGLQSEARPEWFVPYSQLPLSEMHVVAYSLDEPARVAGAILQQMWQIDAQIAPTEIATLSDRLWESVAQPRFNTALLVGLAFCAAVLAAVGIYGVVSYSVVQRTSEIGVRMALGADARDTMRLIVRQAMLAVVVGVVLGVAGALGAARFITGLLYGVEPTDPSTYLFVSVVVLGVGLVAAAIPALRATRVDPLVALREE